MAVNLRTSGIRRRARGRSAFRPPPPPPTRSALERADRRTRRHTEHGAQAPAMEMAASGILIPSALRRTTGRPPGGRTLQPLADVSSSRPGAGPRRRPLTRTRAAVRSNSRRLPIRRSARRSAGIRPLARGALMETGRPPARRDAPRLARGTGFARRAAAPADRKPRPPARLLLHSPELLSCQ
jgi:hypothetical protein